MKTKTKIAFVFLVLALLLPLAASAIAWNVSRYDSVWSVVYRYDKHGHKIGIRFVTGCLRDGFYIWRNGHAYYKAAKCRNGKQLRYWVRTGRTRGDVFLIR